MHTHTCLFTVYMHTVNRHVCIHAHRHTVLMLKRILIPPTAPSTTLRFVSVNKLSVKTFRPNNYTPGWVWLPKNTEWNQIVCSKKLARLETDWSSIHPRKRLQT